MRDQRLRWGSSLRAQEESDAAFKAALRSTKKKQTKRKPYRQGVFVGTYRDYLNSPQWKKKRRKVHKHYGGKCCRCGSTQDLRVHHRHYRTLFREAMADLELLCDGCHQNEHEGSKRGALDPMTREFLSLNL
jgi:5-methylcytosine-specific restriction endonuclease McrA